jgi:hypothetical protein
MCELAFKVLDLILGGLLEKRRKKKALSEQLEALKRHVIHENVVNYLPVHLAKLRAFFLDNGLVDKPEFEKFFERWLTNPFLRAGRPVGGMFSSAQIAEMKTLRSAGSRGRYASALS